MRDADQVSWRAAISEAFANVSKPRGARDHHFPLAQRGPRPRRCARRPQVCHHPTLSSVSFRRPCSVRRFAQVSKESIGLALPNFFFPATEMRDVLGKRSRHLSQSQGQQRRNQGAPEHYADSPYFAHGVASSRFELLARPSFSAGARFARRRWGEKPPARWRFVGRSAARVASRRSRSGSCPRGSSAVRRSP